MKNTKTKLEQVLYRNLNARYVAVWGNPTHAMLSALKPYNFCIADIVDVSKHYVVTVNDQELSNFLESTQSKPFKYADDYINFYDEGGELPFEWACYGINIGRQTYFGDGFVNGCKEGYIKSIGHFTSISSSADIGVNHQLDMVFTSDDIAALLTSKNKALFQNRLKTDKQHPYANGKESITIGSDVYIGSNVFINASKVTNIGDGAIIGAGSVVFENVQPYAVVTGVPAKHKRYRFSQEMIEILLCAKWWEWPVDKINQNFDALMSPDIFMERFNFLLKN